MDRVYVMQLVRSFQVGELSRREFLRRTTLALGSAATANLLLAACAASPNPTAPPVVQEAKPAEAKEEAKPAEVLTTAMMEYKDTDGETLMAYLAQPSGNEPKPAVLVIQEWWGLDDHIKDIANRFAQEGFVALAPDLYHGQVTTEPDEARKLIMELDMAEAVKEIQQGIAYLKQQPFVAGPKVGVVGFCMGGGLVLQTAVVEDNMGAGVAFYGRPLSADEAKKVKAPLLGLYGAQDNSIPVDGVKTMQAALTEAGTENDFHIYEGAQHAFFNNTRESYNAQAAADAWPRTLEWFRQHLE